MKIIKVKIFKILIIVQLFILTKGLKLDGPCKDFYAYACRNYNFPNLAQQLENEFNKEFSEILPSVKNNDYGFLYNYFIKEKPINNTLEYYESCVKEKGNLTTYFQELEPNEEMKSVIKYWNLLGKIQAYGLKDIIITPYIKGNLYINLKPVSEHNLKPLPEKEQLKDLLEEAGFEDIETKIQDLNNVHFQLRELSQLYHNSPLANQFKRIPANRLSSYLQEYLKNLLPQKRLHYVTLENLKYFEYLSEKNYTTEDLKQLTLYLKIQFLNYLNQTKTIDFTPLECAKDFQKQFKLSENFIYLMEFFTNKIEKYPKLIQNLPDQLQTTAANITKENHLRLSPEQLEYLLKKINSIKMDLSDEVFEKNNDLKEYYNNMPDFFNHNYYKNHLKLLQYNFEYLQQHAHLKDPYYTTLPHYNAARNAIKIPSKVFQAPMLFYEQTPWQMISLFGFSIAREITRSINNETLTNDQQEISLSIINQTNFKESLQCLEEQNLSVDINERFSDLFAVRIAYNFYQEHYATAERNQSKKFFKNMAKYFCDGNVKDIENDSNAIRLREIVKNFEPFAEAFRCPAGSAMNPVKKCRIY